MSTTKDSIVLTQINDGSDSTLIMIIDPYSLIVQSEIDVITKDKDLKVEEGYYSTVDNYYWDYPTYYALDNFLVWNKGKYLMVGVKYSNSDCVVYYNVYDTQTKRIISKIERTGELK